MTSVISHPLKRPELHVLSINHYMEKETSVCSNELETIRIQLIQADLDILKAITTRIRLSEKIGFEKVLRKIDAYQEDRYISLIQLYTKNGSRSGLDLYFTTELAVLLHKESLRIQNEIALQNENIPGA